MGFGWIAVLLRDTPIGVGIALAILGFFQAYWTIRSYRTIRMKKDLVGDASTEEYKAKEQEIVDKHREAVLNLWIYCLAPAWFRIPQLFGASEGSPLMFLGLIFTTPFFWGVASATKNG